MASMGPRRPGLRILVASSPFIVAGFGGVDQGPLTRGRLARIAADLDGESHGLDGEDLHAGGEVVHVVPPQQLGESLV